MVKDKKKFFYIDNIVNFSVGVVLLIGSIIIFSGLTISGSSIFVRGIFIFLFIVSLFYLTSIKVVNIKNGYIKSKGKKSTLNSIKYLTIEKSIFKQVHLHSHNNYTFHKFTLFAITTSIDGLSENRMEIISVKSLKKVLDVAKAIMKNSSFKIHISHSQFKLRLNYNQLISSWINKLKDENILELYTEDKSDTKDFLFTTNQDNVKSENACQNINHIYVKENELEKRIIYYQKTETEANTKALILTSVFMLIVFLYISMTLGTILLLKIFLIALIPLIIYIRKTKDNVSKWMGIVLKDNKVTFTNYDPVDIDDIYYIHKSANDNSQYEVHLTDGSVIKLQPYSKIATTLFCQINRELNDIS